MTSNRILDNYTVERDTADGVTIWVSTCDGATELLQLSAGDLLALLAFAKTGQEPPEGEEERARREKSEQFASFLDSLLLTKEEREKASGG